jgi:nicotinate-nucleotide pyrophosphorylase
LHDKLLLRDLIATAKRNALSLVFSRALAVSATRKVIPPLRALTKLQMCAGTARWKVK